MNERSTAFHSWFPVLPFLGYWALAYTAFHFGPFETPSISTQTHVFFLLSIALFVIGYRRGIGTNLDRVQEWYRVAEVVSAEKLARPAIWLMFIGTSLLVFDRLISGAGSVELVRTQMANLRQDYVDNTTILTTLAVIPQSFYLVALASYFYCLKSLVVLPLRIHMLVVLALCIEIFNMVLSANRGALLWIATYALFYAFFCARLSITRDIFAKRNALKLAVFVLFCSVSFAYFLYVAENREVESTVNYLGREASFLLKDNLASGADDYGNLAARYQIFSYLTHGFPYLDVVYQNAPLIHLDLLSPLGVRVEAQIARFIPDYMFPAKEKIVMWIQSAGLSRYNWVSTFGAALTFFGILGALIFFLLLGFSAGYATRRTLQTNKLGWFILTFTIYASLNMSFDWILRNFDQFVALAIAFYLIARRSRAAFTIRSPAVV